MVQMLKIEKKIIAEINRLQGYQYHHQELVDGWLAKRVYYKGAGLYEEADDGWFHLPMNSHTGQKNMTILLKNHIVLPETCCGQRVVLLLKTGGEACLSVNGEHYNGLDFNRNMILLSDCGKAGESYEIEIEVFCKDLILDSDNVFKTQVIITQSELASIKQPVWDYYYEVKTGFDFITDCKEEYTRQRVLHILYDSLLMLDYSEDKTLEESVTKALVYYRKELTSYHNLKLPVTMFFAGHSHIDVAWHWPLKETIRKVSRTFSSMLRLMEQYDEFKFCQSMPVLYEMAKEHDPKIYEQIRERVKEGRWETLGSMYLEPDCNLISGESFVRQIIYGKRFYREELDSDSNICFLPDVFGYSSAMPQILKKAGTDYFFTTKLTWNETNEFPYSLFRWRGMDGTEILSGQMSMCTHKGIGLYNGDLSAHGVQLSLDHFKNKGNDDPLLYLYGHGDGGGGVTKEMLETLTRMDQVPFTPKVEIGTVKQYFESLDQNKDYPVWAGELYFEKHRGTYTTAANNKKNNRKSEFLFRDAEILSSMQYMETGGYTEGDLEKGWKKILLNQFHDILPGTCIGEVYKECDKDYEEIRQIGEKSIKASTGLLAAEAKAAVTVFNTLSWPRSQVISIESRGYQSIKTPSGICPKQIHRENGTIEFLAEQIPSMGYQVYLLHHELEAVKENHESSCRETDNGFEVSNQWLDIRINRDGELLSVYDRRADRMVLKQNQKGNQLKLLEDIPVEWGTAWETTTKRQDKPSLPFVTTQIGIKDHNCLYTVIEVAKQVHHSSIRQEIMIFHHQPMIEFKTEVNWNERQKILRVLFPAEINSLTARVDAAFGNVEHPNHSSTSHDEARFEVCGHKWGDVSDGSYGVSLLNDCKYGYSIQNSDIELSLLRSADFPSDSCDKGVHTFSYWLYPHQGNVREAKVAQAGYEANVSLLVRDGRALKGQASYLSTDSSNVVIDTIKKAEQGEDIIVRLFETYNTVSDVKVMLSFPAASCVETDLLEQPIGEVAIEEGGFSLKLHPYEIKTYRLRRLSRENGGEK